ncbi:MAG: hypothetical protein ACI31M_03565 [Bacilli bacterium]
MSEILNQSEIDKLLASIEQLLEINLPPLPYVKPSQIEELPEGEDKEKWKKDFANAQYLYVYPLEKLLKYISIQAGQKYYKLDYQNSCITQRVLMLEKLLEQKGYTKEQIKNLIPVSEEQQRLLLRAKELGFKDDVACYNDYRIASASSFLQSLGNTTNEQEKIEKGIA